MAHGEARRRGRGDQRDRNLIAPGRGADVVGGAHLVGVGSAGGETRVRETGGIRSHHAHPRKGAAAALPPDRKGELVVAVVGPGKVDLGG